MALPLALRDPNHALADRKNEDTEAFRKFRRQVFHASLQAIFGRMEPYMTQWRVVRCPDGRFRRAIYDLAVYIADYPEQCLLCSIVQDWCPMYVSLEVPPRVTANPCHYRCTATRGKLDSTQGVLRTEELTLGLLALFTLDELWDRYGIVGDVIVCTFTKGNILS